MTFLKVLICIIKSPIKFFFAKFRKVLNRERYFQYGNENGDKVFYIYGQDDITGGLFWIINKTLMHIGYALDHNYIMIVDLQNYKSQYIKKEDFKKKNMWEYYFEQPMGWKLNDIKKSKNIILSKKEPSPTSEYYMGQFYDNPARIAYFKILYKQYIKPNKITSDYLAMEYGKILKGKGRVLGVLCRGTDYTKNKPSNHPIQPDPSEVIRKADEIMYQYNCSYIYLSTEDEDIYRQFGIAFGSRLLVNDQIRISNKDIKKDEWLAYANLRCPQNSYIRGLQYYSSINLLSKCTCFIGGRTGGTKGVLLMADDFEYQYIYDLGYYK